MTVAERIEAAATLENAQAWNAASEKFLFCQELLETSVHNSRAVDLLEDRFEEILNDEDHRAWTLII